MEFSRLIRHVWDQLTVWVDIRLAILDASNVKIFSHVLMVFEEESKCTLFPHSMLLIMLIIMEWFIFWYWLCHIGCKCFIGLIKWPNGKEEGPNSERPVDTVYCKSGKCSKKSKVFFVFINLLFKLFFISIIFNFKNKIGLLKPIKIIFALKKNILIIMLNEQSQKHRLRTFRLIFVAQKEWLNCIILCEHIISRLFLIIINI